MQTLSTTSLLQNDEEEVLASEPYELNRDEQESNSRIQQLEQSSLALEERIHQLSTTVTVSSHGATEEEEEDIMIPHAIKSSVENVQEYREWT